MADIRQVLADQGLESSNIQLLGEAGPDPLCPHQKIWMWMSVLTYKLPSTQPLDRLMKTPFRLTQWGPVIGQQLLSSGLLALLVAFAGIIIYLSLRFKLDYAVLAIIALAHDVLITMGVFAILGLAFGVEVDSLFIVALLTIVGFSVNDTVVIYDRIRENLKLSPHTHINDVVDGAVNQTLTRSINTSFTTVLPLVAIVVFGGETLKFFALALIVGFLSGGLLQYLHRQLTAGPVEGAYRPGL